MADFCKQCSIEMFGTDTGDLAGLSTPVDTAAGTFAIVLCEGCGSIAVDHEGNNVLKTGLVNTMDKYSVFVLVSSMTPQSVALAAYEIKDLSKDTAYNVAEALPKKGTSTVSIATWVIER